MSNDYNMGMHKFLKNVGVTSQQAIEEAMRAAGFTAGNDMALTALLAEDVPTLPWYAGVRAALDVVPWDTLPDTARS